MWWSLHTKMIQTHGKHTGMPISLESFTFWYDMSANNQHPQRHGRSISCMSAGLANTPVAWQAAGRPNNYLIWAFWTAAMKMCTAFSTHKRWYGVSTLFPRLRTAASLQRTRPLQPVDLMSTWSPTSPIQDCFMSTCESIIFMLGITILMC